jgi:flagellar export protein FliJ
MAFQFRLATVLRVRESLEKREERILQRMQLEIARIVHRVEELGAAICHAHELREQAMQRSIPAGHLHSLLWEEQSAVDQQKSLLQEVQRLEQEREQQMKVYQNAHRNRELLTDMFNEQQDVYEHESMRTQQKQLDDIFIARRHRS